MLNNAVIMGRICNDLEVKKTQSGVSVCRFAVAVDRAYAKQGEERQTDFIDILAWRSTADFIEKYFTKGQMIAVQGSIQTGSYEKDGIKRRTFEIVAENVSFCGSKSESNGASETPSFSNADTDDFVSSVDDDELPF
jgi:single-strand DNA-binding protein